MAAQVQAGQEREGLAVGEAAFATACAADSEVAAGLTMQEQVPLAPYTTLGVGGPARWFATAASEAEVEAAVRFARERGLPLFVLGGGSNLLVSDAGFPGLVLRIALRGIAFAPASAGEKVRVTVAAGESWDALVDATVERDLQGMECLPGIPGTVGGTPVQNVGAYGQEIAQTLVEVRCFDTQAMRLVTLQHADFGFGYRTSLLNGAERGRYIVLSVTFALRAGGAPALMFPELKRRLEAPGEVPTLRRVAETVRAIRRGKGMVVDAADPDSRSAGSFFRNPVVRAAVLARVAAVEGLGEAEVPHWVVGEGAVGEGAVGERAAGERMVKLPAAWLLERAGFVRGMVLGRAGISSKHTLALVNRGGATERDIAALRERIMAGVWERFGIELEQEPVNVG